MTDEAKIQEQEQEQSKEKERSALLEKEEVLKSTPPATKVELTAEQYTAILDRMEEQDQMIERLSSSSKKEKSESVQDIDELAREGRGKKEKEPVELDWDSMSNKELIATIFPLIDEHVVKPLNVEIQTLKVMNEIDKVSAKHDDFYDLQDAIKAIAIENPTLSIEKAYKMAKLEAEEGKDAQRKSKDRDDKDDEPSAKRGKGVHLLIPSRPTLGERPGLSGGSTRQGPARTTREAAERAWDTVVGKGGGGV
jgi:hypothetical protein